MSFTLLCIASVLVSIITYSTIKVLIGNTAITWSLVLEAIFLFALPTTTIAISVTLVVSSVKPKTIVTLVIIAVMVLIGLEVTQNSFDVDVLWSLPHSIGIAILAVMVGAIAATGAKCLSHNKDMSYRGILLGVIIASAMYSLLSTI